MVEQWKMTLANKVLVVLAWTKVTFIHLYLQYAKSYEAVDYMGIQFSSDVRHCTTVWTNGTFDSFILFINSFTCYVKGLGYYSLSTVTWPSAGRTIWVSVSLGSEPWLLQALGWVCKGSDLPLWPHHKQTPPDYLRCPHPLHCCPPLKGRKAWVQYVCQCS